MNKQPPSNSSNLLAFQSKEKLEGQIDSISYTNEETGYTVIKLNVPGFRDSLTVVGNMVAPNPGEILCVQGSWSNHPRFGRQFKAESCQIKSPASIDGIKKYLGSGLIKGIGPVMAARIVAAFAEQTLDMIDSRIDRLQEIEGIGPKRVEMIRKAWSDQRSIRDVMIFLHSHGVGSGYAARIFRQYGHNSIAIVKSNPFRLAADISGIGFTTADKIAEKLGFEKNAPARVQAGILHVLNQLTEEGHVYYPQDLLIEKTVDILGVEKGTVVEAMGVVALDKKIVIEDLTIAATGDRASNKAVYLARLHAAETTVAGNLARILSGPKGLRKIDPEKAIQWVQGRINISLAPRQTDAVQKAASEKVLVITGGPGTGKTTIINAAIKIYQELNARILLAAPTGRASKRMSEATGFPARTIHRLLEFSPQLGGFQRNKANPLEVDILIIDEVSMIDIILMHHLLEAVPDSATLILVGDVNQLPSIGAGSVLKDIISSGATSVVELNEIFRQSAASRIIINAHRINNGLMPELKQEKGGLEDFYFIEQEDPDQALKVITELVTTRIPKRFQLDPVNGIQVLSPMHKGVMGTENLNRTLQEVLNHSKTTLSRGDRIFKLHDKVIQTRNNYEKEVFNGDIGKISSINPDDQTITVDFDGHQAEYDYSELDEIRPAYAISVHKSQGSEYPAVVLPLMTQHYIMLQRNLIYTAITRGKRLVVIVGSKKALAIGIGNNRIMKRYTFLSERLKARELPEP
jgi:exodeoxyribonuclease V alpha subunit